MSATAAPFSPMTLKLKQFAYGPPVCIFFAIFYLLLRLYEAIWMNRPFEKNAFNLLCAVCLSGSLLVLNIGVIPVHDLTLDGDELVITNRGKVTRRPLSTLRHIEEYWFSKGYEVRFQDRRRIKNIKGVGAKEFVEELSRRSGVVIEK